MLSLRTIAVVSLFGVSAIVLVAGVIAAENVNPAPAENSAPPAADKPDDQSSGESSSQDPSQMEYAGTPNTTPTPPTLTVHTTTLGRAIKIQYEMFPDFSRNCSPDYRHFATPFPTEDGQCMMVDGNGGPSYMKVGDPVFSQDSRQVAYVAETEDEGSFLVIGDEESKAYDRIKAITFSPDSKRLAYIANTGKEIRIVTDDKEGKAYPAVDTPLFSPDSKHVAYATGLPNNVPGNDMKVVGKGFIVFDDKEVREFDELRQFVFSGDSAHWACVINVDGKWLMVEDGVDGAKYDHILSPPIFSPDSKHLAYIAESEGKYFVVLDGKEGKKYDHIIFGAVGALPLGDLLPVFSPDSQHIAYVAIDGGKYMMVRDTEEGKKYDRVVGYEQLVGPVFSPDSKHLAYIASDAQGEYVVVNDNVEGAKYIKIGGITFSPDSASLVYTAATDDGWCLVNNGVEGKKYGEFVCANPPSRELIAPSIRNYVIFISADSKHVAYAVKIGEQKQMFVVDGVEGKEYTLIRRVTMSTNGDTAYMASADGKDVYVVDGVEVDLPDNKPLTPMVWDAPAKCHGIAKGRSVVLLEIEVTP